MVRMSLKCLPVERHLKLKAFDGCRSANKGGRLKRMLTCMEIRRYARILSRTIFELAGDQ